MPKLKPKLILEGARLTNKTELAHLLNDHPALAGQRKYPYYGGLISAEWSGLGSDAWGESLITFSSKNHERAMHGFDLWVQLFECLSEYRWTVDRFHISAQVYQSISNSVDLDFTDIEKRLYRLGFRLIMLRRSEESFQDARERRLLVSGNPGQYHDLPAIIRTQKRYEDLANSSLLSTLVVDVSQKSLREMGDEIVGWLASLGDIPA